MAVGSADSGERLSLDSPPLFRFVEGLVTSFRRLWRNDLIRLVGLTIYYLAIIAGLVVLYGGAEYVPPPFVYQGF